MGVETRTLIWRGKDELSGITAKVRKGLVDAETAGKSVGVNVSAALSKLGAEGARMLPALDKITVKFTDMGDLAEEGAQKIVDAQKKLTEFGGGAKDLAAGLEASVNASVKFGVSITRTSAALEELAIRTENPRRAVELLDKAMALSARTGQKAEDAASDLANAYQGQTDALERLSGRGQRYAKILKDIRDPQRRAAETARLTNEEIEKQPNIVDRASDSWQVFKLRQSELTGGFDLLTPALGAATAAIVAIGAAGLAAAAKTLEFGVAATRVYLDEMPQAAGRMDDLTDATDRFMRATGTAVGELTQAGEVVSQLGVGLEVMAELLEENNKNFETGTFRIDTFATQVFKGTRAIIEMNRNLGTVPELLGRVFDALEIERLKREDEITAKSEEKTKEQLQKRENAIQNFAEMELREQQETARKLQEEAQKFEDQEILRIFKRDKSLENLSLKRRDRLAELEDGLAKDREAIADGFTAASKKQGDLQSKAASKASKVKTTGIMAEIEAQKKLDKVTKEVGIGIFKSLSLVPPITEKAFKKVSATAEKEKKKLEKIAKDLQTLFSTGLTQSLAGMDAAIKEGQVETAKGAEDILARLRGEERAPTPSPAVAEAAKQLEAEGIDPEQALNLATAAEQGVDRLTLKFMKLAGVTQQTAAMMASAGMTLMNGLSNSISTMTQTMVEGTFKVQQLGQMILSTLGDVMINTGNAMILQGILATPFGGGAVASGALLVAAGGALKGVGGRVGGGGGGGGGPGARGVTGGTRGADRERAIAGAEPGGFGTGERERFKQRREDERRKEEQNERLEMLRQRSFLAAVDKTLAADRERNREQQTFFQTFTGAISQTTAAVDTRVNNSIRRQIRTNQIPNLSGYPMGLNR